MGAWHYTTPARGASGVEGSQRKSALNGMAEPAANDTVRLGKLSKQVSKRHIYEVCCQVCPRTSSYPDGALCMGPLAEARDDSPHMPMVASTRTSDPCCRFAT